MEVLTETREDVRPGPWSRLAAPAREGRSADTLFVTPLLQEGDLAGYGALRTVRGKDQPITILITTDTAFTVTGVEIVTYREPYGGEVRRAVWREQFTGRRPGERLRHAREILNITGATISARAVTDGVRRTLEDLQALRTRLPGPDGSSR
jgi:Na+-translocating ferredoxin:NAD+ oxidoreductase RnfG subunit